MFMPMPAKRGCGAKSAGRIGGGAEAAIGVGLCGSTCCELAAPVPFKFVPHFGQKWWQASVGYIVAQPGHWTALGAAGTG